MATHTAAGRRLGGRLIATTAAAALLLGYGAQVAGAQEPPFARGIDRACVDQAKAANQFADVDPDAAHSDAIDCLWVYGVVQGRFVDGDNVYGPGEAVNRQQMASFVVGVMEQVLDRFHELPDVGDDGFEPPVPPFEDGEQVSTSHRRAVTQLAEMDIVSGFDDGTYRPGELVSRAQLATFVAGALEELIGEQLPRAEVFDDVSGVHQPAVEKLAAIGVVQGREDGSFGPNEPSTRAQMASYIARSLDYLVDIRLLYPTAFSRGDLGAMLGLTDVGFEQVELHERVTFTLEGDDQQAGWRVEYVDTALAPGTGDEVDVEGGAILRVILTGIGFPDDVDADLWEDSPLVTDGAQIIEVVDAGMFEGQQTLFVGVTDLRYFTVERLEDPQRIELDVYGIE